MAKIEEYIPIVGAASIDDLKFLADRLKGKSVLEVNSTAVGGGVAEMLNKMVPLFNELGVKTRWEVIKGGGDFFTVTKKFHNALHGRTEEITSRDFDIFIETSRRNIEEIAIDSDIVIIHDPQPIALISKKTDNKWVWRCHVDVSGPDQKVWHFLRDFIVRYDASIFSSPNFTQNLPIRQFLIAPSIDPLSDKNRELEPQEIAAVLGKYNIAADKPIVLQVSRFDRLKDPLGVIEAYLLVKKDIDCQLVLAGGTALDDPEGAKVLEEVQERAKQDADIHILLLPQNDTEVNALQRAAAVIVQKSLKEGFGLTVTEALWKAKPVVASNVGGIPLQVKDKYTGLLCYSFQSAALAIKHLLENPEYAAKLGANGREHVKNNFLLTRNIRDYMLLFLALYQNKDMIYL